MSEIERLTTRRPVELRAAGGNSRRIGGYAAVFGKFSKNLGGYVERVAPTFFNDSRGQGWPGVIARYNHDDNMLLGATVSDTLRLSIDSIGLNYDVDLPQSRDDVLEMVTRGDIGSSSFAFETLEDNWSVTEQGFPLRTLVTGRLHDVAPVARPAYPDATVGLRSLAEHKGVPMNDVVNLAKSNDLRKLFLRTGVKPHDHRRAVSGASAKMTVTRKAPKPPLSGHIARAKTLAKKHPKVPQR